MPGVKSKLENFWYYYKVHTMVALAMVVIIAIGVSQCASVEKYDYSVVLYMSKSISEDVTDVIADQLAAYGTDQNGDGKVTVEIINCSYGDDDTARMNQIGKLQARLTMAQSILFIVDDDCYTTLNDQGLFADAGLPDKDGTALDLSNTALNAAVTEDFGSSMPTHYYICKRKIAGTSLEADADAQQYEAASAALLQAFYAAVGQTE